MDTISPMGQAEAVPIGPDWDQPDPAEKAALAESAASSAGSCSALSGHPLLEDVIPQIYYLAQHVGGMRRLAEIVAELERSQPD
jgi:hypothetical protein